MPDAQDLVQETSGSCDSPATTGVRLRRRACAAFEEAQHTLLAPRAEGFGLGEIEATRPRDATENSKIWKTRASRKTTRTQ